MKTNSDGKALKWLWSVSGHQKWNIFFLTVLHVLIGGSGVLFAFFLRGMINAAVACEGSVFVRYALYLVVLTACQLMVRAGIRFLTEYLKSSLENVFKSRLFSELMIRDYESVSAHHSGDWLNRLTSDTVVIAEGISSIIPNISGMSVQMIGALAMIFYLIPGIGFFVLPVGILLTILTFGFRKVLKRLHGSIQESDGRLRVFLSDRLTNLLVVKSFALERETSNSAEEKMAEHLKARMKRNHFSNICNVGFGIIMRGSYVAGAVICARGILQGTMSYGNLMAVMQLIGQVQAPFADFSSYLPKYYAMLASAERMMEAESFPKDAETKRSTEQIHEYYKNEFAGMGFEHLYFSYGQEGQNNPIVLKDVSFSIDKGEYLAITGDSGCGKSTLLKLLMCLYKPEQGEVYLQGKRERIPCSADWRGLFAYVPQGNQLMSGTIREIVAFSKTDLMEQEERIWDALSIADADGFVRELPEGLDAVLGERGAGLSEGQIQRLAIARAILSGHPILLFDEATSSLDEKTERQVLEKLRNMTDRTVIIVTHRMSILSICQKQMHIEENGIMIKNLLDK